MPTVPERTKVFISYSHKDARHLDRLHAHLAYYERLGLIESWDDTKIIPGTIWREEIKKAIASAKVAILLVSADFLASQFIAENELLPLLTAAQARGAVILPIILSPCGFEASSLSQFQALNSPSKPLSKRSRHEKEEVWLKAAQVISNAGISPKPLAAEDRHIPQITKPVVESSSTLKKRYMRRRIMETQDLAIEGIPLIPPRVPLDEIFIPVQLYPHQRDIDQWLTPEQRTTLREGMSHGMISPDVERVLISAERQHESALRESETISIARLWQGLTREHPAAVIQGYPGMGKSTLLLRLTLFMARRGVGVLDPLEEPFAPVLIPVFLRLGAYATFLQMTKDGATDIWAYLRSVPKELGDLADPVMHTWLCQCLARGECLVLFDGLDEVSDWQTRTRVQESIKAFVADVSSRASSAATYTRVLITSRVAGYDHNAFPGYPHYTIAELIQQQISAFLSHWCRASVRGSHLPVSIQEKEAQVMRQAAALEQRLRVAIQTHQGIRELVENPFLLTLLAVLQQNGVELPDRRVELYTLLVQILLEYLNVKRGLPKIPEAQAVQRLGPLAYQMQATKNNFVTAREALESISNTIEQVEQVLAPQAWTEAVAFVERVRVRGGIFVLRTGDYYGFFHRSMQEYFAARYLLSRLATEPGAETDLVQKARQMDDLWREPFLLAIAHGINDVGSGHWHLLRTLLSRVPARSQYAHNVLLVAACLLETKESTIPYDLERDVMHTLFQVFEDALQDSNSKICFAVGTMMERLLYTLSAEAVHAPRLVMWRERLLQSQCPRQHHAALILLTLIDSRLQSCKDIVLTTLVPPLLGLTQLPAYGPFTPEAPEAPPDFACIDLALAALRSLGTRGPTSVSLISVLARFEPYLPLLARYSLEVGFPLTPVVVPLDEEHYTRYKSAIEDCKHIHARVPPGTSWSASDETLYVAQLKAMFAVAEETCYPAEEHLLEMLRHSSAQPEQPWQSIWQTYLRKQMQEGSYLTYHICALLWVTVFPQEQAHQAFASVLKQDLLGNTSRHQHAQHLVSQWVSDLSDSLDGAHKGRDPNDLKHSTYLYESRYLMDLHYLSYWSYLLDGPDLLRRDGWEINCKGLGLESKVLPRVLTEQVVAGISARVPNCAQEERSELITLLMGRLLTIQRTHKKGPKIVQEITHLVRMLLPYVQEELETRRAVLELLRQLPMRTEHEIIFVLDLAETSSDADMQRVLLIAVSCAQPESDAALALLEQRAQASSRKEVSEALEERLQEYKKGRR